MRADPWTSWLWEQTLWDSSSCPPPCINLDRRGSLKPEHNNRMPRLPKLPPLLLSTENQPWSHPRKRRSNWVGKIFPSVMSIPRMEEIKNFISTWFTLPCLVRYKVTHKAKVLPKCSESLSTTLIVLLVPNLCGFLQILFLRHFNFWNKSFCSEVRDRGRHTCQSVYVCERDMITT